MHTFYAASRDQKPVAHKYGFGSENEPQNPAPENKALRDYYGVLDSEDECKHDYSVHE